MGTRNFRRAGCWGVASEGAPHKALGRSRAARTGWFAADHRGLARGRQRLKDARVGVERLVGDQRIGLDGGQQVVGPDKVVCLAAGQEEVDRVAQRVDQGVDLGAQSAARARRNRRAGIGCVSPGAD